MQHFILIATFAYTLWTQAFAATRPIPKSNVSLPDILAVKAQIQNHNKFEQINAEIDTFIKEKKSSVNKRNAFSVISFVVDVLKHIAEKASASLGQSDVLNFTASKIQSTLNLNNLVSASAKPGKYTCTLLHVLFAKRLLIDSQKPNFKRTQCLALFINLDKKQLEILHLNTHQDCCILIDLLIKAGARKDIPDSCDKKYYDLIQDAKSHFPFLEGPTE